MIIRCIVLFFLITIIHGATNKQPPQCCKGVNIIKHGKCSDGLKQTGLRCQRNIFLVDPTDDDDFNNYTIDAELHLILSGDHVVPPDEYCLTQMVNNNSEPFDVALICSDKLDDTENGSNYKYVISAVCCLLSAICIIATLCTYVLVPELRDLQGKCLMATIFSLAISFSCLSFLQLGITMDDGTCKYFAFFLYFWFMATFFWLNVVCIQVWKAIVYPFVLGTERQWFIIYNCYGWGAPIIFLLSALIAEHVEGDHIKPEFGLLKCWFQGPESSWAYFYGPIGVLLIINLGLFFSTCLKLWNSMENNPTAKIRSHRYKCLLYLKLFVVMGITWFFELISFICGDNGKEIWIITDLINALQGVIIFCLLVLFRKRALRGLARRGLCFRKIPKTWVTMVEEDCEQLDADTAGLSQTQVPQSNA